MSCSSKRYGCWAALACTVLAAATMAVGCGGGGGSGSGSPGGADDAGVADARVPRRDGGVSRDAFVIPPRMRDDCAGASAAVRLLRLTPANFNNGGVELLARVGRYLIAGWWREDTLRVRTYSWALVDENLRQVGSTRTDDGQPTAFVETSTGELAVMSAATGTDGVDVTVKRYRLPDLTLLGMSTQHHVITGYLTALDVPEDAPATVPRVMLYSVEGGYDDDFKRVHVQGIAADGTALGALVTLQLPSAPRNSTWPHVIWARDSYLVYLFGTGLTIARASLDGTLVGPVRVPLDRADIEVYGTVTAEGDDLVATWSHAGDFLRYMRLDADGRPIVGPGRIAGLSNATVTQQASARGVTALFVSRGYEGAFAEIQETGVATGDVARLIETRLWSQSSSAGGFYTPASEALLAKEGGFDLFYEDLTQDPSYPGHPLQLRRFCPH